MRKWSICACNKESRVIRYCKNVQGMLPVLHIFISKYCKCLEYQVLLLITPANIMAHTYIYIPIHTYTYTYFFLFSFLSMRVHAWLYVFVYLCHLVCLCLYMPVYSHISIHYPIVLRAHTVYVYLHTCIILLTAYNLSKMKHIYAYTDLISNEYIISVTQKYLHTSILIPKQTTIKWKILKERRQTHQ